MERKFSEALDSLRGSATREIYGKLHRPGMISLAGGSPAVDCIPMKELEEIAAEVFSDFTLMSEGYRYAATEGFTGLRERVLKLAAGLDVDTAGLDIADVIITSGGSQALDLALKAFIGKGDTVLVENPTYLGFLQTANSYRANVVGVDANKDGLDIEDLERKIRRCDPKLLYVVPTFSNPTGKTYTVENRRAILALAEKYNVIILEDDPYSRLRFSGQPVPPIKFFDKDNAYVVYVSSFSKVIAPGIRLAFSIGPEDIIRKMTIIKQGSDLSSSNISQLLISRYLDKGYYFPMVERGLPIYRERKIAMSEGIKKYMPDEFTATDPEGGLFVWGAFNAPINTAELFMEAIEKNVAFIQGAAFYADGGGLNTIRLNFSNENPATIDRAVKIIGDLAKEKIAAVKYLAS
jgi:2-aminoadipate transaminase